MNNYVKLSGRLVANGFSESYFSVNCSLLRIVFNNIGWMVLCRSYVAFDFDFFLYFCVAEPVRVRSRQSP